MDRIVSFSGGKDSTAMLIRMLELGMKIDKIVFADTTLEYPEHYAYIKKIEQYIGRKIIRVRSETGFYYWFYGLFTRGKLEGKRRGMPYLVTHGWCCRELKIKPQAKIQNKTDIIYLGIAYDERNRMQKAKNLRYPLVEWKFRHSRGRRHNKCFTIKGQRAGKKSKEERNAVYSPLGLHIFRMAFKEKQPTLEVFK